MTRRSFINKSLTIPLSISLTGSVISSSCSFLPPKEEIEKRNQKIGLYEEWLMGLIALKNIKTPLYNQNGNLDPLERRFQTMIKNLHYKSIELPFWRETYKPPELIIFKSKAKNAFTLPGGFICMTTGMIAYSYFKNREKAEDILSSIIAHELGHLYQEHPKKHYITMLLKNNISRQYREMAEGIQTAAGDFSNDYTKMIIKTILKAKEQGIKGYQAEMEYEADQNAVSILTSASINPNNLISAMTLLKHHMGGIHGSYEDRVKRVEFAIKAL